MTNDAASAHVQLFVPAYFVWDFCAPVSARSGAREQASERELPDIGEKLHQVECAPSSFGRSPRAALLEASARKEEGRRRDLGREIWAKRMRQTFEIIMLK